MPSTNIDPNQASDEPTQLPDVRNFKNTLIAEVGLLKYRCSFCMTILILLLVEVFCRRIEEHIPPNSYRRANTTL
jgi:hypothetical protein